jgi:hypothetical protein
MLRWVAMWGVSSRTLANELKQTPYDIVGTLVINAGRYYCNLPEVGKHQVDLI